MGTDEVLKRLLKTFYRGSLQFYLEPKDANELTWEKQKEFLVASVQSDLLTKYPVNRKFSRLFFKKLIANLEPYQEIHDDFYSFLCSVMLDQSEVIGFSYRHYVMFDDYSNLITIKETNNIVVNGTTGMRTWEAALMLADWAISNKKEFVNKKVLELGSGVGFTGIAIAKHCNIDSIMLTDCRNDLLNIMSDNIHANFPNVEVQESSGMKLFKINDSSIGVMMLDWVCPENLPAETIPDVVLGADIVYDPSILQPLSKMLQCFFHRNKSTVVYIAGVKRNEDTFKCFLEMLRSRNFGVEMLVQSECVNIFWDENIERFLLKIKCT